MTKEIPYYTFDNNDGSDYASAIGEAYIDDEDLRQLLIDLLGDKVSKEDIQEILDAASDEDISEDEFDKLIDEFILKNSE